MNKVERLEELAGKFKKVVAPKLLENVVDKDGNLIGVKKYDVPVFDDTFLSRTIPMVVFDEGTEKEEAGFPSLPEAPSWPIVVKDVLDTAVAAGKFKKYVITEINNDQEFAKVDIYNTGWYPLASKIGKQQRYLYDDGKGVGIFDYSGE